MYHASTLLVNMLAILLVASVHTRVSAASSNNKAGNGMEFKVPQLPPNNNSGSNDGSPNNYFLNCQGDAEASRYCNSDGRNYHCTRKGEVTTDSEITSEWCDDSCGCLGRCAEYREAETCTDIDWQR